MPPKIIIFFVLRKPFLFLFRATVARSIVLSTFEPQKKTLKNPVNFDGNRDVENREWDDFGLNSNGQEVRDRRPELSLKELQPISFNQRPNGT